MHILVSGSKRVNHHQAVVYPISVHFLCRTFEHESLLGEHEELKEFTRYEKELRDASILEKQLVNGFIIALLNSIIYLHLKTSVPEMSGRCAISLLFTYLIDLDI